MRVVVESDICEISKIWQIACGSSKADLPNLKNFANLISENRKPFSFLSAEGDLSMSEANGLCSPDSYRDSDTDKNR
jgi:hypothetical protein